MRKLVFSILVIGLFTVLKKAFPSGDRVDAEAALLLGIVIISAYLIATILKKVNLPKLTGYMILGILLGPIGFNFLNHAVMDRLDFLTHLALAFIALTAGGEFKIKHFYPLKKPILNILLGQIVFVITGLFIMLWILSPYLPFFSDLTTDIALGFSILFAVTALSTSPAVTMGMITEFKAQGRFTDIVLSVTVLKTIVLLLIFPMVISFSKVLLVDGISLDLSMFADIFWQISSSILIGIILGFLIILYLKYVNVEKGLFLLGIAVVITEISFMLNVEILLTSIITGIVVENFSKEGDALIEGIEKSSLTLYVIFFSLAGAGLHLETLRKAFIMTLILVIGRMALKHIGSYAGAVLAREQANIKRYTWTGFIGQAGIAVGLGNIIYNAVPGETGLHFRTILIATVVINEMIGPIIFKYGLTKTNEAGQ